MQIQEIKEYAEVRSKARAYLCYIIDQTVLNNMKQFNIENLLKRLDNLQESLSKAEVIYALDAKGIQLVDNISKNKKLKNMGKGDDRSDRAYFYKTFEERRCVLTTPYPSLISNEMVVTASFPVYNEQDELLLMVCVDISLKNILKMILPSSMNSFSGTLSKIAYTSFSIALSAVSLLLFVKGISSFMGFGLDFTNIDINEMFKATILLTLSLAIFDLVKAIFEEEVLGKEKHGSHDSHQTMVRFLGSIIIALSIEALMLVFKFALTDPSKLEYAIYLISGVSLLLVSLSVYIKFTQIDKK